MNDSQDKKRVVVIFGGPSTEHDISIITGIQAIENLNPLKYEIIPVYWSRENQFLTCSSYKQPKEILKKILKEKILISWDINQQQLILGSSKFFKKVVKPDVIIPALHGSPGEDGNIQGLLDIFGVPFVGSSMGPSYIAMNKSIFKQVMKANDISILPWQMISPKEKDVKIKFKFPVICKPNSLGSSIGVSKCKNSAELKKALALVFELDEEALIEPYVEDLTEINCSVMGDTKNQEASVCERPLAKGEILGFNDKYLSGGKSKVSQKTSGMASLDRIIPADIPAKLSESIQKTSKEIFRILGCTGLVRIDYIFSKKTCKVVVNEINSIPGSYSFYLWEPKGLSFRELLDKLIAIAISTSEKKNKLTKTFNSPVLDNFLKSN